jgi:hypothetical protein
MALVVEASCGITMAPKNNKTSTNVDKSSTEAIMMVERTARTEDLPFSLNLSEKSILDLQTLTIVS